MAQFVRRKEAVDGLLTILTDAQNAEPKLVEFIKSLWIFCRENCCSWPLDRMPIHTDDWRKFTGATSHPPFGPHAYLAYRAWMMSYRYRRQPLLVQVEVGRTRLDMDKAIVGTYRVGLPMCEEDPWEEVMRRLPKPTTAPGFNMHQIVKLRKCLTEVSGQCLACHPSARAAQLIETAKMAAYAVLLGGGKAKRVICPRWPDKAGVDLAVFRAGIHRPHLIVIVGKGQTGFKEALRRFDHADDDKHAARVYLSVHEPTERFKSRARSEGVTVIRGAGVFRNELRPQTGPVVG